MSQEEVDAANRLIIDSITKYKVIIAGCRDFTDYELLREKCDYHLQNLRLEDIVIVSGHASGADSLGERYAQERGFQLETYPADWQAHGRAAGPIRNAKMANVAHALIAFWDGKSRGTKNMIETARKYNLKVAVVRY
ncbi:DUF2493 domain-containing protein [Segatella copri]|jgi:hypothetical protein|uniref:DUF2493 domain-containing protein n=1 Tax=Segatella copri TaxID=165179 RepID=UPI001C43D921|nr:DUF2493 domain-containing protein [Segatella copri]MBW0026055.1 DUF2493 domain-containing protein [Segatella copri]